MVKWHKISALFKKEKKKKKARSMYFHNSSFAKQILGNLHSCLFLGILTFTFRFHPGSRRKKSRAELLEHKLK